MRTVSLATGLCILPLVWLTPLQHFVPGAFAHLENSVIFVAIVGSVMTCVYVVGLMERRNRTVFGVGWDSAAALLLYGGSMTVLYFIR